MIEKIFLIKKVGGVWVIKAVLLNSEFRKKT